MKSIKVTILGREYPLKVKDNEEESMREIAQYVDDRFQEYKKELKKLPETTILTMACLSIAEELFEERRKNQASSQSESRFLHYINESLDDILDELKK